MTATETLTYSQLAERARLMAQDLGPFTPLELPAGVHFAAFLHAAWSTGKAIAPLNPALPEPALPVSLPAGTLAVVYTSGTTGEPRPVALTRGHFEASATAAAERLPLTPADRWLCCLPVFHVAGLSIFTRCAIAGATVLAEASFDAQRVRSLLEAGELTVASLVPTMLTRLRDAGLERAPGLRGILLGGGPIPPELLDWAAGAGLPVMPTYGMTETCSQIATAEPGERRARPLPGVELRIADDGEILVRGPMVAADGWLHTGDRGTLDADGRLELLGRMDDLIVTGGENVAAREVEEALLAHPGVREAAVIGLDDPEWGRAVTAFVVSSASVDELAAHARQRLPAFKVPKAIHLLDELPRTPAGKVHRRALESCANDLRQGR